MKFAAQIALGLAAISLHAAGDPFAEGVRPTDPLTPEQQQKTFKLPPGFSIQLVAAEPHLRKPMNMQFDGAGRLWFTESREYPWPTNTNPRDTIRILSDFDENGRANKVTTFATNLNIPIGLYPFQSPSSVDPAKLTWKCIAWSIPSIWLFEDTDGDNVADKKDVLLGPFDFTRDTHGNQASFRRGLDGWIYATHGFNNRSRVTGKDGHEVFFPSGNTYRFRTDGWRIEHWTHGQVNPFGLTFDGLGNLYSADCHSSPIYQLLRGGWYPSFGAPDDGLGFAPTTVQHSHGSTAICGITVLDDPSWPEEFRDQLLIGNVMTSRINRDRVEWRGSTSVGHELPDFVSVTDPWFRPVDLQLGPDGALWVADFYNRIIGHYEVPLTHPLRDRERGRIWRIVPPAKSAANTSISATLTLPNDLPGLLQELASPNRTRRYLAQHRITDTFGTKAAKGLRDVARGTYKFEAPSDKHFARIHAAWALLGLNELNDQSLLALVAQDSRESRVHAAKILAEVSHRTKARIPGAKSPLAPENVRATTVMLLRDADAFVQRAAADALGADGSPDNVPALVDLLRRTPKADSHLCHTARIALRDCLKNSSDFTRGLSEEEEANYRAVADVCTAITNSASASFLLAHIQKYPEPREALVRYLKHIARYLPAEQFDSLAPIVQKQFPDDTDLQLALFKGIQEGASQRGVTLGGATREWGTALATRLLAYTEHRADWQSLNVDGSAEAKAWGFQERGCADGQKAQLMSSHANGEHFTGVMRSVPFSVPPKLRFYLCGHDGQPGQPALKKNVVRLKDAQTHAVLREAWTPRNDTAQRISWDLGEYAGKRAYFEVRDAINSDAYAWLAFGRFDPALPQLALGGEASARQQTAAEIARALQLTGVAPALRNLVQQRLAGSDTRLAAARALASFPPNSETVQSLASVLNDGTETLSLREKVAVALAEMNSNDSGQALLAAVKAAPARLQTGIAVALAGTPAKAELMVAAAEKGAIPARLLQDRVVRDKLAAAKLVNIDARLSNVTQGLAPLDEARAKAVEERRKAFLAARPQAKAGASIFTKNCAACHQLDGQGALIGPQLDGIGARGAERIIEDIIDPSRNVDHAFATTMFVLADGDVVSGLFRREEGEMLVYAEASGKENSIPKKQVKEQRQSELSLMPEGLVDAMSPQEFNDLIAFLASKTATKAK